MVTQKSEIQQIENYIDKKLIELQKRIDESFKSQESIDLSIEEFRQIDVLRRQMIEERDRILTMQSICNMNKEYQIKFFS